MYNGQVDHQLTHSSLKVGFLTLSVNCSLPVVPNDIVFWIYRTMHLYRGVLRSVGKRVLQKPNLRSGTTLCEVE